MSFKRADDDQGSAERELAGGVDKRATSAPLPLTQAQMNELDRRLAELDRDPDGGQDWDDLREELLQRVARRRASAA
ncbi:MAG TPA: addiction module protein [Longimicrobium sp.]|nr:addiction module protein [Longimicrobium sp.]